MNAGRTAIPTAVPTALYPKPEAGDMMQVEVSGSSQIQSYANPVSAVQGYQSGGCSPRSPICQIMI